MVMLTFIGNTKTNHNLVQEFGLRQTYSGGRVIVPGTKNQLIFTDTEFIFRQQRLGAAAIAIGRRAADESTATVETVQLDQHTCGRAPVGGIEYMCGKKSH